MKKITYLISFMILTGQLSWAQTTNPSPQPSPNNDHNRTQQGINPGKQQGVQQGNKEPRKLSDKTVSGKLQKDLGSRNGQLANQPVSWYDAGYGYYGTYDIDGKSYMTRYDRQGNYVETLNRKEWDSTVPSSSKTAFDNSEYNGQQVTGYWESTEPGRKGSYYELSDGTGKTSRVWADDQGAFSSQPSSESTGLGTQHK